MPYFFPYPKAVANAIENPSVEIVPPTVGNVKLTPEPFVILPPIVALPEIVTLFGKPIVSVCPLADVSISFVVPAMVNDCVSKSTANVPLSPAPSKSAASNALLI